MLPESITKTDLQKLGATAYMIRRILSNIRPLGKKGRKNLYPLVDIFSNIKEYLISPRIKNTTRSTLNQILSQLQTPKKTQTELDQDFKQLPPSLQAKIKALEEATDNLLESQQEAVTAYQEFSDYYRQQLEKEEEKSDGVDEDSKVIIFPNLKSRSRDLTIIK